MLYRCTYISFSAARFSSSSLLTFLNGSKKPSIFAEAAASSAFFPSCLTFRIFRYISLAFLWALSFFFSSSLRCLFEAFFFFFRFFSRVSVFSPFFGGFRRNAFRSPSTPSTRFCCRVTACCANTFTRIWIRLVDVMFSCSMAEYLTAPTVVLHVANASCFRMQRSGKLVSRNGCSPMIWPGSRVPTTRPFAPPSFRSTCPFRTNMTTSAVSPALMICSAE